MMLPAPVRPPSFWLMVALLGAMVVPAGCATTAAPVGYRTIEAQLLKQARQDYYEQTVLAQQLFIRGMAEAQFDNHTAALELYRQALALMPGEPAVLSAMAESYQVLGDLPSALFHAEEARRLAPGNVHVLMHVAALYRDTGSASRAIDAFQAALHNEPRNEEALFQLGRLLSAEQQHEAAAETFERLAVVDGERVDLRGQLLDLYKILNDDAGIERSMKLLIDLDPRNRDYRRHLADFYVADQQYENAVAVYEAAVAADAADQQILDALSELHRQVGREGQATLTEPAAKAHTLLNTKPFDREAARAAAAALRSALNSTASPDPNLLRTLADLEWKRQAFHAAAEVYDELLRADPRDLHLWARASAAYRLGNDPQRAADIAEEAALLFPGQPALLHASAAARMDLGQTEEAMRFLDEALRIIAEDGPGFPQPRAQLLTALAGVYAQANQYPKSDSLYARALQDAPNDPATLSSYASSLAERGRSLDRALSMALRAVEEKPDEPEYMGAVGWVLLKQGRYNEAQGWFERSIRTGLANAAIYEHFGDLWQQLGDSGKARSLWLEALELNPGHPELTEKVK